MLTDETSTTTDVAVDTTAMVKVIPSISDQKGLAMFLSDIMIPQELGPIHAVLTRGLVLPTKVIEIDATSRVTTNPSR